MHVRATYREYNETTEVEFKGCVPVDSLRSKYNEICNQSKGVTECSHVCCRENLCNENINQGEGCLKCDYCPESEESLVFNHSTPLNTSYTSHQCNDESVTMVCPPWNFCVRLYRKFQNFEVERRFCTSMEHCDDLNELCRGPNTRNDTYCHVRCCQHDVQFDFVCSPCTTFHFCCSIIWYAQRVGKYYLV